ncbi:MAG: Fibronectin type III domain protein [Microgenomates group bacterium ADurb.Bin219]|nr:MAG: Fibronectin type III domain protein [Microgenomates group bacterium ADurb.Bin219]HNP89275.1 fibronectin type III domain-containing protein [Candidatus Woesebacteria bacterium]
MKKFGNKISLTSYRYFKLILCLFVAILVGFLIIIFSPAPTVSPQNLRISNVTDSSLSISWTTDKPVRSQVIFSQQENRILRSLQLSFLYPLLLEKYNIAQNEITNPSYTHHVTLKNLKPNSSYYYRIVSNNKVLKTDANGKILPDIKTASALEKLSMPQPIFSRVFQSDGKTGAADVLVYLVLIDGENTNLIKSSTLSTFTDIRGVWSLDLGNLRQFNQESFHEITKEDLIFLEARSGRYYNSDFQSATLRQPARFVTLK